MPNNRKLSKLQCALERRSPYITQFKKQANQLWSNLPEKKNQTEPDQGFISN